jgi:hypothetical protein
MQATEGASAQDLRCWLATLALCAAGASHAAQWWGSIGVGAGHVSQGATSLQAAEAGSGFNVDLAGGVTLAHRWQLGVDAGTLIQQVSLCGYYCTPEQERNSRSLDHYYLTARYHVHSDIRGPFVQLAGGVAQFRDGHVTDLPGPARFSAQQHQGMGPAGAFGIGFQWLPKGKTDTFGVATLLAYQNGRITPDDRSFPDYSVRATTLSVALTFH